MELRPYQQEAISALWTFWKENPQGAPLIVAPTGSGKSCILSEICRRVLAKKPQYKILVVSHRKEIIEQNAKELCELLKEPIGIYSAGLGQKTIRRVTCGNIQSIYKKKLEANLVILDECHLIGKKSDSMYQQFLQGFYNTKLVGLTATPMRLDQGSLVGENATFTEICYNISISALIADGFLSPLISKRSEEKIDFSDIHKSGYDYSQEELQAKMSPMVERHAKEILERTKDRKHILIFCSGVKHAAEISKALGSESDFVTGEMVPFERDRKLRQFSEGRTRYLCNCEILTTGYNFPSIDCVVLLRATQSAALYIQAVGRGSRVASGKNNCLVLDFGGNIDRHGPIDLIRIEAKGKRKASIGVAPTKDCPTCGAIVAIKTLVCPSCEYDFPPATCKMEEMPSERPIISAPEIFTVENYNYKVHKKEGKPPSLRLVYSSKYQEISEFLCFEHGGYASHMAERKWVFYGGNKPAPKKTEEAFTRASELKIPTKIEVLKDGKYFRISKIVETRKPYDDHFEDLGVNI